MRLIILGPPGSGKGVQSKNIAAPLGLPQISTGDILRQAVKEGNPLGQKARSYMDQGLLVPDELMAEMVRARLLQKDAQRGFILEGYPRTLFQAETLDKFLSTEDKALDAVLELKISDESVIERLTNRRLCSRCNSDYNLLTKPPKRPGICDRCSGILYQRDDDRRETIAHRLQVYHRQTEPLEEYYRRRGALVVVDAEKEVEEVRSAITRALECLPPVGPTQISLS